MLLSTYFAPFYTPVLRHKGSTFSTTSPTLVIFLFLFHVLFLIITILVGMKHYLPTVLMAGVCLCVCVVCVYKDSGS